MSVLNCSCGSSGEPLLPASTRKSRPSVTVSQADLLGGNVDLARPPGTLILLSLTATPSAPLSRSPRAVRHTPRDSPLDARTPSRYGIHFAVFTIGASAMSNPFNSSDGRFVVLQNDEAHYSLWPADMEVPAGWEVVLEETSRQACLAHVEERGTDLRPAGLAGRTA